MYIHMCGHGCGRRRATHSKAKTKGPAAPQPWPQHHRGTVHTALHKISTGTSTESSRRRVATSPPSTPTSAPHNGAQRSARCSSDALPAAQTLPGPQTSPPAELPPFPIPLLHAGQARRDARGRAVRGLWRGCWRVLVVCVGGCGGGQMGLGQGGHTRTNGLLTGADGQRMFGSNFR